MKAVVLSIVAAAAACRANGPEAAPRRDVVNVAPVPADAAPPAVARVEEKAVDAGCTIVVGALRASEVFTGVRDSPMRRDHYEGLPPAERARWDARDHGVSYLLCTFGVTMNGEAYTFAYVAAERVHGPPLDPSTCSSAETRTKVAADVHRATNECADPHAHAYWGSDLVPIVPRR